MQLKVHAFDCEFYLISVCSDFDFWAVHILKIRKNKFCAKMYMFTLIHNGKSNSKFQTKTHITSINSNVMSN